MKFLFQFLLGMLIFASAFTKINYVETKVYMAIYVIGIYLGILK